MPAAQSARRTESEEIRHLIAVPGETTSHGAPQEPTLTRRWAAIEPRNSHGSLRVARSPAAPEQWASSVWEVLQNQRGGEAAVEALGRARVAIRW